MVITGAIVTAIGVAMATLCVLGARSDRYLEQMVTNVLHVYRRPITQDAIAGRIPYVRSVLIAGCVIGVGVTFLGILTLLRAA